MRRSGSLATPDPDDQKHGDQRPLRRTGKTEPGPAKRRRRSSGFPAARNAIMYSLTRLETVPAGQAITSGMMKVVSRTNRTEIPSTPTLVFQARRASHALQRYWKPVFAGSNSANRSQERDQESDQRWQRARANLALRCAASSLPRRKTARTIAATRAPGRRLRLRVGCPISSLPR